MFGTIVTSVLSRKIFTVPDFANLHVFFFFFPYSSKPLQPKLTLSSCTTIRDERTYVFALPESHDGFCSTLLLL